MDGMPGGMVCDGLCAEGWHVMGMPRTPSFFIEVPWPSVP